MRTTDYTLKLGGNQTRADALHKIHSWAPKRAKTFTIHTIRRYQYASPHRRESFWFVVEYFNSKSKGKYSLGQWDWKKHCLNKERFSL